MRCRDLASRAFSALAHDAPGHCVVCRDHSKHLRCPGALVLTPTIQFPNKLWLTSGVLSSGREGAGLPRIRRRAPKGAIGAAPRSQRDFRNQVLRMTKHHRPGTETLGMSQVLAPERIQMAWVSDRGDGRLNGEQRTDVARMEHEGLDGQDRFPLYRTALDLVTPLNGWMITHSSSAMDGDSWSWLSRTTNRGRTWQMS